MPTRETVAEVTYDDIRAVEQDIVDDIRGTDDLAYAAGRVDGAQEFAAALAQRLNLDRHE